jgi:hypothetical protein
VREDGTLVGGEGRQEKGRNREEWTKLLRTARNHCILHMAMEWNDYTRIFIYQLDCLPYLAFLQFSLTCLTDFKKLSKSTMPPFPLSTFLCPPELHHSIHTCSFRVWGFCFLKIRDFLLLGD